MAISAKIRPVQSQFRQDNPPHSLHITLSFSVDTSSLILRFPSADVRLLRALLQESGETINTSLQNGEGTEQAALLGELCVSEREGGGRVATEEGETVGRGKTELFQAIPPRRGEHRPGSKQICLAMSAKR